jgi:hypothetical protein
MGVDSRDETLVVKEKILEPLGPTSHREHTEEDLWLPRTTCQQGVGESSTLKYPPPNKPRGTEHKVRSDKVIEEGKRTKRKPLE